jgi:hypothetical protein
VGEEGRGQRGGGGKEEEEVVVVVSKAVKAVQSPSQSMWLTVGEREGRGGGGAAGTCPWQHAPGCPAPTSL